MHRKGPNLADHECQILKCLINPSLPLSIFVFLPDFSRRYSPFCFWIHVTTPQILFVVATVYCRCSSRDWQTAFTDITTIMFLFHSSPSSLSVPLSHPSSYSSANASSPFESASRSSRLTNLRTTCSIDRTWLATEEEVDNAEYTANFLD